MAEKEVSGDFDYLWDDPDDSDGVDVYDQDAEHEGVGEFDYLLDEPDDDDEFDAFDENTWNFAPSPPPWYRSRRAMVAIGTIGAAVAAIVVSAVLLVFRGPTDTDNPTTLTTLTTTSPTTTPVVTATSPNPPAPPPPPPAATITAPEIIRPTVQPRPKKEPEIGVTRTPATRSPISVSPAPRPGFPRN